MTAELVPVLTLCAAVGCGLVAGLLLAFSCAVIPALARLPASQAILAMQAINESILNLVFLLVFFGTTLACAALVVMAAAGGHTDGQGWRVVGALMFLLGTFGVTVVRNVPLNQALAAVDPASGDAGRRWERYRAPWTAWNHLRTAAGGAAAVALTLALAT